MESTFDRATKLAGTQLTKMRWALGLNGLLSVAVGVVILVWPGISLFALTILFGAYALATSHPEGATTNAQAQADNVPQEIDGACCFNFQQKR